MARRFVFLWVLKNISHFRLIVFSFSDYVHRAGRTARKGQQGSALLFLMPSETVSFMHM